MALIKGAINNTTGFRNPNYVYSDFVDTKEKVGLDTRLKKCLEIFYEAEFTEEVSVYKTIDGIKPKGGRAFKLDNYAIVNNIHLDVEFNGPEHYTNAFKINTDQRKNKVLKDPSLNKNLDYPDGRAFQTIKVPYYLQLTKDFAKYLFHDESLKKLNKSYYSDEKYLKSIQALYFTDDEKKVLAPGLHNSKFVFGNFNSEGIKRFLKEMKEMSSLYPSIAHQVIYSFQLYIEDLGDGNQFMIIPDGHAEFMNWYNSIPVPDPKYLNYAFLRDKRKKIY